MNPTSGGGDGFEVSSSMYSWGFSDIRRVVVKSTEIC